MNLNNISIVLDHPDEPRNIGAACRAMANSDIKDLRIVGKKEDYDVEKVHILAIHAAYIFDNARFFNNINEATADCALSAGTTRRRGKNRGRLILPEEFAREADLVTGAPGEGPAAGGTESATSGVTSPASAIAVKGGRVAIVFGNERTGLTDDQLDMCTLGVTIPTSNDFGSLNLSHAVQILCYHMFRQSLENTHKDYRGYTPVTLERIDGAVKCVTDNLQRVGFFKMPGREDMEEYWRSLLARANLSEGEVQYLEKIFTKMSGLASKNHKSDE